MNITQRTPKEMFTVEKLHKLLEDNPEITFNDIFSLFEKSYTRKQLYSAFRSLRNKSYITYEIVKEPEWNLINLKILPIRFIKKENNKENNKELAQWKIKKYIDNIYILDELIQDKTIKSSDRIKAIELQQKALKHVEGNFALVYIRNYEELGDIE